MSSKWTNDEYQKVIQEVLDRASIDPQFRALTLSDSTAALKKVASKPIPPDISFKFVDNSGNVKTIPLPDPTREITQEDLSDAELEEVAGGVMPATVSVSGGWAS